MNQIGEYIEIGTLSNKHLIPKFCCLHSKHLLAEEWQLGTNLACESCYMVAIPMSLSLSLINQMDSRWDGQHPVEQACVQQQQWCVKTSLLCVCVCVCVQAVVLLLTLVYYLLVATNQRLRVFPSTEVYCCIYISLYTYSNQSVHHTHDQVSNTISKYTLLWVVLEQ